jgi:hypothetical protein
LPIVVDLVVELEVPGTAIRYELSVPPRGDGHTTRRSHLGSFGWPGHGPLPPPPLSSQCGDGPWSEGIARGAPRFLVNGARIMPGIRSRPSDVARLSRAEASRVVGCYAVTCVHNIAAVGVAAGTPRRGSLPGPGSDHGHCASTLESRRRRARRGCVDATHARARLTSSRRPVPPFIRPRARRLIFIRTGPPRMNRCRPASKAARGLVQSPIAEIDQRSCAEQPVRDRALHGRRYSTAARATVRRATATGRRFDHERPPVRRGGSCGRREHSPPPRSESQSKPGRSLRRCFPPARAPARPAAPATPELVGTVCNPHSTHPRTIPEPQTTGLWRAARRMFVGPARPPRQKATRRAREEPSREDETAVPALRAPGPSVMLGAARRAANVARVSPTQTPVPPAIG